MSIQVTKRPYNYSFSGNPVHYELYSSQAVANSAIYFEVRVKFKAITGAVFQTIVTLPYYPTAGYAKIDLAEVLDGLLEWGLPGLLPGSPAAIWGAPTQTGRFYIEYREISSANGDPTWDTSEEEYQRFVIKGGLNDFKWQGNNFWLNYFDTNKPFLTWQKNGRLATYNERMYLAWLDADYSISSGNLLVEVKVFYTDGTTDVDYTAFPTPYVKGQVYFVPSGAEMWDLDSWNPSKTILYWTIRVVRRAVLGPVTTYIALSEVFRYELDNRNDYIDITLNYRNSLGGIDSVRINGSLEKKTEYDYTEVQNTIEPDYFDGYNFQSQKKVVNSIEQVVYIGNTRPVGREEADRLRDMHVIRDTWWEKDGKWVPVHNITKGFSLEKNDDMLWSMPFEFTLGYNGSSYYTPDSAELGAGVFTSNVCRALAIHLLPSVVVSGIDATIGFSTTEVDPDNNSDQIRYRILEPGGGIEVDWTTILWSAIGSVTHIVPAGSGTYRLEVQTICANNVNGKTSIAFINSSVSTVPSSGNSFINNNGALPSDITLIDGHTSAVYVSTNIPSFGQLQFNLPDGNYDFVMTITDFSPSSVILTTNGNNYTGYIGGTYIMWSGIVVVGGIIINIY